MPSGRTNPSVSSDDPLVTSASDRGSIPVPQKMAVKPRMIITTHTPGSSTSPSGAYMAITASRRSNVLVGRASRSNNHRSVRKWTRVRKDTAARGSTTVRTADPRVQTTTNTPARRTATRATDMRETLSHPSVTMRP